MQLSGLNGDLSGNLIQPQTLSAISFQNSLFVPDAYGLSVQPTSNSLCPEFKFDANSGWLTIAGDAGNNVVKQTITDNGDYQFDIDGSIFSSDRTSAYYAAGLAGASKDSVFGINFNGGLGYDTLIVGSQEYNHKFDVIADDAINIAGQIWANSIFLKAEDILNQGEIIAGDVTAEFSNSYTDVTDAKIVAIDGGHILLNGGKDGNLNANGQFTATGLTGGKIDFRGKTLSLSGAKLDASGENGGGTILIGGDYQGIDPTGLNTLTNARSVFVDQYSSIKANALTQGNGGKVIIWSDENTDFRGNINARGGTKVGDGGFVEVSGKQTLNFVGKVNVDATNGKQGNVLLDPADIIINADDGNASTFDVSDLQKIQGNVILSATNNIVFNTETNFSSIPEDVYEATITLKAGNSVVFIEDFDTVGRNLNISASFIKAMRHISSNDSSLGKSGNIQLVSRGGIDLKQVSAYGSNNAGNITLKASTFIKSDVLDASVVGGGSGGDIRLSANKDIFISDILTHSRDGGSGGSVNILRDSDSSERGSIVVGQINTSGGYSGGNVRLSANQDITTSDIVTYSTNGDSGNVNIMTSIGAKLGSIITYSNGDIGKGGNVTINSEYIFMNGIASSSNGGLGGKVTLKSNQDIILGSYVSSSSVRGNAGAIWIVSASGSISGQGLSANSKQGNGANIDLTANQLITTGLIDSGADGNGNGGNIKLSAFGDILTSTIVTNSNGSGKSGNISLVSSNGNIKTTNESADTTARLLFAGANLGNAGSVTLNAFGNIEATSIFTSSNAGNAGNVKIEAGGNILTGAIASNTFDGSGKGGNITLDGKNITAESLRADSVGAGGGQIRLTADKFIRVTGSTSVNGKDYSIFTDSKDVDPSPNDTGARSAPILIRHSQKVRDESLIPFIIGDSSKNGTATSISDGIVDFLVSSGNAREVYDFDFKFNDIYIKRPFALLADISNILGIPGVPILKKESDIINNILKFSPYIPNLDIQSISNSVVSLLSRISKQELVNLGLGIQKADLDKYYSYLITAMAISGINSVDNQAHFVTQLIHESDRFKSSSEKYDGNDYIYFENKYGYQTEAGMDLGNTKLGDGSNFRGRGLIQITGRDAYKQFGEYFGLRDSFLNDPKSVSSNPILAVLSSIWFWTSDYKSGVIKINTNNQFSSFREISEANNILNSDPLDSSGNQSDRVEIITLSLNGGYNGLGDRKLIFSKIRPASVG